MDPATQSQRPLIIGSRASKLAQIQAEIVENVLKEAHPSQPFEIKLMTSEGDRNQTQALYLLGGKALWTKDLEAELLNGSIDLIVHCLKDVPTSLPEGCEMSAILEREDPRDTLVVKQGLSYTSFEEMPAGSVIGTSSVRRVAQLRKSFPHLAFQDVRGNLNTRLAKLDAEDGPYTALVLAGAGLERLGFKNRITSYISPPVLYPAVGQAALAVETRIGDSKVTEIVSVLTHWQTQWQCLAERACLRVLEGGCSVPVGVETTLTGNKDSGVSPRLKITGTVTSLDGLTHVAATIEEDINSIEDAEAVGRRLAEELKASGADAILEDIKKDRAAKQQTTTSPLATTTPSQ
ncbi:porphobilinogen deaminase [Serendipita sp. 397]|nr:porphobilinogen deaminase [Serendipita sp. 397]